MSTIDETIAERSGRYGSIASEADIVQHIKSKLRSAPGWARLSAVQTHVLEMIAVKIARIVNGNPNYPDNWHDIAGYATLGEKELSPPAPTPVLVPKGQSYSGIGILNGPLGDVFNVTPDTRNAGTLY